MALQNASPIVYEQAKERELTSEERDDYVTDRIDAREIFDILFKITSLHRLRHSSSSTSHFLSYDGFLSLMLFKL